MTRTVLAVTASALAVAGSLAAGLAGTAPASARQAPTTTVIKPAELDRGPEGDVPHVQGPVLVDGSSRFVFDDRRELYFLGMSGDDYVVGSWVQGRPDSQRVVRVTPGDERTTVLRGQEPTALSLSSDGERLMKPRYIIREARTRVFLWDSHDGTEVTSRKFRGYVDPLDATAAQVVLGGTTPDRTLSWDTATDDVTTVSDRHGYEADLATDRLAVLTGDPYEGGCSVVSTLSDPTTRLWRSCTQAVAEFSPTGDHVTTVYLQSDGLGPGEVQLREVDGSRLATYTTYYFGELLWESDDTLLVRAHGRTRTAWVRCGLSDCERTSRLTPTRS